MSADQTRTTQLALTSIDCGICGAAYRDLVPVAALSDGRQRALGAALALPACPACVAQAEASADAWKS